MASIWYIVTASDHAVHVLTLLQVAIYFTIGIPFVVWRVQSNCSVMVIMAGDLVTEDMVFNVIQGVSQSRKKSLLF